MTPAQLLAGSSLFCELDPLELQQLASLAVTRKVRARERIVIQGEIGQTVYSVVRGRLKVIRCSDDGREVGLAILQEGDVFGEMSVFQGTPRNASVDALEECEVLELRKVDIERYLQENPRVMRQLITILCNRLASADDVFEDALLMTYPRRLAKLLRTLVREHGVEVDKGIEIDLALRNHDLARFVGGQREQVSRQLSDWVKQGWITTSKMGKIVVHDLEALPV